MSCSTSNENIIITEKKYKCCTLHMLPLRKKSKYAKYANSTQGLVHNVSFAYFKTYYSAYLNYSCVLPFAYLIWILLRTYIKYAKYADGSTQAIQVRIQVRKWHITYLILRTWFDLLRTWLRTWFEYCCVLKIKYAKYTGCHSSTYCSTQATHCVLDPAYLAVYLIYCVAY